MKDIVTPVNVQALESLLVESNYCQQQKAYLVSGFRNGFSLGYQGNEDVKLESPNLKFRGIGNDTILWNKVMKEVACNRYAGPYKEVPLYLERIVRPIERLSVHRGSSCLKQIQSQPLLRPTPPLYIRNIRTSHFCVMKTIPLNSSTQQLENYSCDKS